MAGDYIEEVIDVIMYYNISTSPTAWLVLVPMVTTELMGTCRRALYSDNNDHVIQCDHVITDIPH